jgi:hypothetical protein
LGIKTMDIPVHEWVKTEEYSRWVCPHMVALLSTLESRGHRIAAIGLANHKAPEAVIFVTRPLSDALVKQAIEASPALEPIYNGIGKLHAVSCAAHYVSMRYSDTPT